MNLKNAGMSDGTVSPLDWGVGGRLAVAAALVLLLWAAVLWAME